MTGMDIPAGTTGNSVPEALQNNDGITPSLTPYGQLSSASTDLPHVLPTDSLDIELEAEKIRTRNAERRALRDAGADGISEDEEELGSTEETHHALSGDHQTAFLAAWSLMSDVQKKDILGVIGPKAMGDDLTHKPKTTAIAGPIFSEEKELSPVTAVGAHKFGIHPEVRKLAAAGLHVPISLFLAKSMRDIFLKTIPREQHILGNTKTYLIKIDNFPDENLMDPTDWLEAWSGYLAFLESVASPGVFLRWKTHYRFLSGQEDLRQNFSAILRFDIEQRRQYAAQPTTFHEETYYRRFTEVKNLVMKEENDEWRRKMESGASRTLRDRVRNDPYPASGSDSSRAQPFQQGNGEKSGLPICLICARLGHKFPECTQAVSEGGKQLVCRSFLKKLVSVSSSTPVCISWNLGGKARCQSQHPELHTCSFCGAKSHYACSRACI
ncbi:hypothetical protein B0H34DRAFT_810224 [Crassisporium funariophilum]|nr:hypothetical protein B0H34DRAFT_810224 [Crassisporium funariophilum]